jgi:hypothetical protein
MNKTQYLKKNSSIFLILFALLLLAVLPMIVWHTEESHQLNVWILDNTVPDLSYREHRGLMWTLNHFKITPLDQSFFKYDRDYYGFFPYPDKTYTVKDLTWAPNFPDMIYLADSYGVYRQEFMETRPRGDRSPLIYGGLSAIDMFRVREFLRNDITVIGEFNTFATPTSPEIRHQLEEVLGVRWKEWMGRYFQDLKRDKEVTRWMVRNYEAQYRQPWNFEGPGYVLTSNWDEIVVLESGIDVGKDECRFIVRDDYQEEFDMSKVIPYYYWFDFVAPMEGTETIADFYLDVTETGRAKLASIGLNEVFPAILRNKKTDYQAYYFSGDFADHTAVPRFWNYRWLSDVRKRMTMHIKGEANAFFWRGYVPLMKKILHDVRSNPKITERRQLAQKKSAYTEDGIQLISKADEKYLYSYQQNEWKPLFLRAVNMGMAEPGKWSTEFPSDEFTYERWFNMIAEMNANAVRVYTLMDPSFYRALYLYNIYHPDKPIYLLQGIWPEEHPPNDDYIEENYMNEFLQEIHFGIDAVHGNITIPERKGRAWGRYIADCSPYTIAWLVGREFEPQEVHATNELNPGWTYEGTYLSCTQGSPTEAWLTWSCDQTVAYEVSTYGWERPVSFVSWPTLDPMQHDSEWNEFGDKSKEWNDWMSVDINLMDRMPAMKGGFFGSYHIYPNFPDFMNNELDFYNYSDDEGRFLYRGYLQTFIEQHTRYPALVAEFGLATGMGNAHSNPDGYHHGALTERVQGEGIVRMFKNMYELGYIGGVIFEWMDEWAKKTWSTEPFMIPFERHVFWHNAICPEQNYGILANESIEPEEAEVVFDQDDIIEQMSLKTDVSYLYIDLTFKTPPSLDQQELIIGLDTYDRDRGEMRYRQDLPLSAPSGMEFKVSIKNNMANLLVIPSYNAGFMKFQSKKSSLGIFEPMNPIINKERIRKDGSYIPEIRENASILHQGSFEESLYHYHWINEGKTLRIRLPWGRLNVTDPSSFRVLDDPRTMNWYLLRDEYQTARTDGFIITAILADQNSPVIYGIMPKPFSEIRPFSWKRWEEPLYRERLKNSYPILQQFLGSSYFD